MSRLNSGELGVALGFIVVGLLLLAGNLGLFVFDWGMLWGLLLIGLGAWMVWRAFQPSQYAPATGTWFAGFGDYRPDLAGKEIRKESFSHGFGDFDLDLTRAMIPEGQNAVRASHGFGDLTVSVPRDLAVRIKASAGFGDVQVFGQRAEGIGPRLDFESDDYVTATRKLDLEVNAGFGDVSVVRAG